MFDMLWSVGMHAGTTMAQDIWKQWMVLAFAKRLAARSPTKLDGWNLELLSGIIVAYGIIPCQCTLHTREELHISLVVHKHC